MMIAFRDETQPRLDEGLTAEELADLAHARRFVKEESGYQRIQGTKPQTLS
jgi:hypothetical protein